MAEVHSVPLTAAGGDHLLWGGHEPPDHHQGCPHQHPGLRGLRGGDLPGPGWFGWVWELSPFVQLHCVYSVTEPSLTHGDLGCFTSPFLWSKTWKIHQTQGVSGHLKKKKERTNLGHPLVFHTVENSSVEALDSALIFWSVTNFIPWVELCKKQPLGSSKGQLLSEEALFLFI